MSQGFSNLEGQVQTRIAQFIGAGMVLLFIGSGLLQWADEWSPEPWLLWPGVVLSILGFAGVLVAVFLTWWSER